MLDVVVVDVVVVDVVVVFMTFFETKIFNDPLIWIKSPYYFADYF